MKTRIAHTGLVLAALFLAGCTGSSLEDIAPHSTAKATRPLPAAVVQSIRAKGMSVQSPIMLRIFKEEAVLEVWKQKDNGRYDIAATYDICKWSGQLGPKFVEGDRQAPEGFYFVRPAQMNPQSSYHLSFNMGYPNTFDRAHGRTGQHLMVHGGCSSAGCYSMTDEQVEQIYAFARDAFKGGQEAFQVQAFPFRMTAANMARYRKDPNYEFWKMLKEGYDHFEITKMPPKVDVCGKRYVFNQIPSAGQSFQSTASCPVTTQPQSLTVAYQSYKVNYDAAFDAVVSKESKQPLSESIDGVKEATLIAEWSRRRARGERVTREPPTMERPEILMAQQQATTSASQQPPAIARRQSVETTAQQTAATAPTPAPAEAPVTEQAKPSIGSRLLGMFGG